jgi:hypothetical protein
VSGAIRNTGAAINRRNGRGPSTVAESDQSNSWQLALPKKSALHLDDRPANGCHRNSRFKADRADRNSEINGSSGVKSSRFVTVAGM